MNERIDVLYEKIMNGLKSAGRNKRKIAKALDQVESELKQQTGPKTSTWTEEYYLYLMEGLRSGLSRAIGSAVEMEEYEWAAAMRPRLDKLEVSLREAPDPLEKVSS